MTGDSKEGVPIKTSVSGGKTTMLNSQFFTAVDSPFFKTTSIGYHSHNKIGGACSNFSSSFDGFDFI